MNQVAPKGKVAMLTRVAGGQKTIITWQDAPDDLFYKASGQTKKVRYYCFDVALLVTISFYFWIIKEWAITLMLLFLT